MRWESWRNKVAYVLVFAAGLTVGSFSEPVWKYAVITLAQERFGELTFRCDSAMREHLIAKARAGAETEKLTIDELRAAELALLDCQEYDLMRKRLILLGLSDNELSLMSLRAIEKSAQTLEKVVEIHEVRY